MEIREQLQRTLGGAYTLERELGGGGMSQVFLAEETALGRKVVVKVLPPGRTGDVNIERFKREIQVAARLQHAHIVPVLSAGETNGLPLAAMITQCLAKDPTERPASAIDLARVLDTTSTDASGESVRDALMALAMPKSVTTALPPDSITLSGLMSPCWQPARSTRRSRSLATFDPGRILGTDSWMIPLFNQKIGEIYESQGNRGKAVEHYRKVIEVWKNADPELQVIVNEIKARVRRLTDIEGVPR